MDVEVVPREEFIEEVEKYSDPCCPLREIEVEDARYLNALMRSILVEGYRDPVLIEVESDGTRLLWDGHHRLIAMKRLGRKTIPTVYGTREQLQPYFAGRFDLWNRRL